MNKYCTYYYLFYNKSKRYYIKTQYNKLKQEISHLKKLEFQLFKNNNDINIDNNNNNGIEHKDNDNDNNDLSNINILFKNDI